MGEARLHGVGVDIVDVPRFAHLMRTRGDSFTTRWFSSDERAASAQAPDPAGALAERFAVKEAAWKAVGVARVGDAVPWAEITVGARGPTQAWDVHLSGWVGARVSPDLVVHAVSRRLGEVALAIAHAGALADTAQIEATASGGRSGEFQPQSLFDRLDEHRSLMQVGGAAPLLLDVAEDALDLIGAKIPGCRHRLGIDAVVQSEQA